MGISEIATALQFSSGLCLWICCTRSIKVYWKSYYIIPSQVPLGHIYASGLATMRTPSRVWRGQNLVLLGRPWRQSTFTSVLRDFALSRIGLSFFNFPRRRIIRRSSWSMYALYLATFRPWTSFAFHSPLLYSTPIVAEIWPPSPYRPCDELGVRWVGTWFCRLYSPQNRWVLWGSSCLFSFSITSWFPSRENISFTMWIWEQLPDRYGLQGSVPWQFIVHYPLFILARVSHLISTSSFHFKNVFIWCRNRLYVKTRSLKLLYVHTLMVL